MKNFMTRILVLSLAVAAFTSCKQEPIGDQPLHLEIEATVGTTAFDSTKVFNLGTTNARARIIGFQLLFSNIRLVPESGDTIRLTDTYINYAGQLSGAVKEFDLGEIPAGKYKGLVMTLGMPVAENTQAGANAKNPVDFPTGHPLNETVAPTNGANKMFWSWNSGYIFVRMDGYVDISAGNTGGDLTKANSSASGDVRSLQLHVGVNGNQQELVYEEAFEVTEGGTHLPIEVHIDHIFEEINLKTDFFSHSMGSSITAPATMSRADLAKKVAAAAGPAIHLHMH